MSTEEIVFARAKAADLPAVRALLERCKLPAADLTPTHLDQYLVCWMGGEVVGSAGLEIRDGVALLRSLAVAPAHRGRRLAHGLWTRIQDEARLRGIQRLYLLTTTAEGLFARWGFRGVARDAVPDSICATAEFAVLCPGAASVMFLDLA